MATKDRSTLLSDLLVSFPNNTSGLITPAILRGQQTDIIDSVYNLIDESPVNEISISTEADFPTQDGTTITLETGFAYKLTNLVTTAKRFICEVNSALVGPSLNIPALVYTGTLPMFTTTARFYALQLNFSCASSDMLDHNGPGFVVMTSCVCSSCDSPGDVSGGLVTLTHTSIFGITASGLTWSGTGNSFIVFDSIITTVNAMTLVDFSTATFTDISIGDSTITGPVGSTFLTALLEAMVQP
jgi:hypothetical protein